MVSENELIEKPLLLPYSFHASIESEICDVKVKLQGVKNGWYQ